ncbi:SGNH/GDSL hydrolase family protein [Paracoccus indicus]|uniref:SGNH/GDSL hydrolase family protein n=1 Tax=Paracoccus indicus TaxID=2079229 RepID=UPI0013B3908A|nr:SGNH/GDSL hydrolase family protein [Paracoccus indicus]
MQRVIDLLQAGKADIADSGKLFNNRLSAVIAGQENLPAQIGRILVSEGDYLVVRGQGLTDDDPLFETQPSWGVAARYPSVGFIDALLRVTNPAPAMVPLFSDAAANVAVWLNEGMLDAAGMAPGLRDLAVQDVSRKVTPTAALVPVLGAGGQVLIWADAEGLVIPGYRRDGDGGDRAASVTDGASLHRVRTRLAQIRAGVPGAKLKIAGIGDSWWEMPIISRAFRARLDERLGLSGEGFRPAASGSTVGPATWSQSGWSGTDGSSFDFDPIYGSGPDGNTVWTNTASATMALVGVVATEMQIYSYEHGGTWRYRVDAGPWVTVNNTSSGAFKTTLIGGLSDAAHTLEIDTTGNAGVVSMAGIYTTRNVNGAEVLKFGNGGTIGARMINYIDYVTAPMADMQPDVVVLILGTNDYRNSLSTPQNYIAALDAMVSACRAAVPDIGFIICVPPQTDGVARIPLSEYRDAARMWCAEEGHEYISLFDRWSDYATANGHGLFLDSLHVTQIGADVLAEDILTNFIFKG